MSTDIEAIQQAIAFFTAFTNNQFSTNNIDRLYRLIKELGLDERKVLSGMVALIFGAMTNSAEEMGVPLSEFLQVISLEVINQTEDM